MPQMTTIDLGRPEPGDVIDLIVERRIVQQAHTEGLLDDAESA